MWPVLLHNWKLSLSEEKWKNPEELSKCRKCSSNSNCVAQSHMVIRTAPLIADITPADAHQIYSENFVTTRLQMCTTRCKFG